MDERIGGIYKMHITETVVEVLSGPEPDPFDRIGIYLCQYRESSVHGDLTTSLRAGYLDKYCDRVR